MSFDVQARRIKAYQRERGHRWPIELRLPASESVGSPLVLRCVVRDLSGRVDEWPTPKVNRVPKSTYIRCLELNASEGHPRVGLERDAAALVLVETLHLNSEEQLSVLVDRMQVFVQAAVRLDNVLNGQAGAP